MLDADRFGLIGWSAGGPHALALAAVSPERVRRVALVGSMPPPDAVGALPRDVQRLMRRVAVRAAGRGSRARALGQAAAASDREPADRRRVRARAHRVVPRRGLWLARELAYLGRPWDFSLAEVRAPVTLWWGADDRVCPPSIGDLYARELPDAELRVVDGTHQVLFARWGDILADAARMRLPRRIAAVHFSKRIWR